MIKKIGAVVLCVVLISACFAACSDKKDEVQPEGLEKYAEEYGFEEDEDGNLVAVVYIDGKAYYIDDEGKSTGKEFPNPKVINGNNKESNKNDKTDDNSGSSSTPGSSPNRTPDRDNVGNNTSSSSATTTPELTTLPFDEDSVPSTSATGTPVKFSDNDIKTITNMLEVPYLYTASFENTDRVPIEVATHVACWMLERENLNTNTFASGTVVIDIFNYFARTVTQFKTECNNYTGKDSINPAPIAYDSVNDTFAITAKKYEEPTHTVDITRVENLGNNNYYKVVATVTAKDSSCKAKNVVAVIQKNKLDPSLGFSVKAIKWS